MILPDKADEENTRQIIKELITIPYGDHETIILQFLVEGRVLSGHLAYQGGLSMRTRS